MTQPAARDGRRRLPRAARPARPPCASVAPAHAARRILACALLSFGLALPAPAELFVCAGDSVRVFADDVSGPFAPLRTISGPATGLTECYAIAVDVLHGEIFVPTGAFVRVYGWRDDGDVAPLRSLGGPATQIIFAASVAVDVENDEVLVGSTSGKILTFPRTASGDVAPLRVIQGAATTLNTPASLFVDLVHDEVFAAESSTTGVLAFARTATGDVPPLRPWPLNPSPRGLFVDPRADEVYVALAGDTVLVRDRVTGGNNRLLSGFDTELDVAWGVSVTSDGELLVGNQEPVGTDTDEVYVYSNGPLGDVAPIRSLLTVAPANRNAFGITSSRALACGAGNVTSHCLFRDGFEDGDASDWSSRVGLVP